MPSSPLLSRAPGRGSGEPDPAPFFQYGGRAISIQVSRLISARHWDARARRQSLNWWSSSKLRDYVNSAVAEEPATDDGVVRAVRKRIGARTLEQGVSVGCGKAQKEIRLLAAGVVGHMDLFEISPQRIAAGHRDLAQRGLADRASYFNKDPLTWPVADHYDLVHWDHSLHHMADVRQALAWSRRALVPGGLMVVNDYIGPNRLQWTALDVQLANGFLAACRVKYGLDIPPVARGNPLSRLRVMIKDPSEAPESELIMAACRDVLDFEPRPIGGALLNVAASRLLERCEEHHLALDDMIRWDDAARRRGHSHFAFGIWIRPVP